MYPFPFQVKVSNWKTPSATAPYVTQSYLHKIVSSNWYWISIFFFWNLIRVKWKCGIEAQKFFYSKCWSFPAIDTHELHKRAFTEHEKKTLWWNMMKQVVHCFKSTIILFYFLFRPYHKSLHCLRCMHNLLCKFKSYSVSYFTRYLHARLRKWK